MTAALRSGPTAPTSEVGIYLRTHEHSWLRSGSKRYPTGSWHPVFTCSVCGDVICDLHVEVDAPGGAA